LVPILGLIWVLAPISGLGQGCGNCGLICREHKGWKTLKKVGDKRGLFKSILRANFLSPKFGDETFFGGNTTGRGIQFSQKGAKEFPHIGGGEQGPPN